MAFFVYRHAGGTHCPDWKTCTEPTCEEVEVDLCLEGPPDETGRNWTDQIVSRDAYTDKPVELSATEANAAAEYLTRNA